MYVSKRVIFKRNNYSYFKKFSKQSYRTNTIINGCKVNYYYNIEIIKVGIDLVIKD